jgi:DNA-binding GntR family transcriptional regulator
VEFCGNPLLLDAYNAIAWRIQALRNRLSHDAELNRHSLGEHAALTEAVRRQEPERAQALLVAHIGGTRERYISILPRRDREK